MNAKYNKWLREVVTPYLDFKGNYRCDRGYKNVLGKFMDKFVKHSTIIGSSTFIFKYTLICMAIDICIRQANTDRTRTGDIYGQSFYPLIMVVVTTCL